MEPFAIHLYGPQRQPLPVSFEDAQARLTALERMFFEPDGSFVWVGGRPVAWQVDGMLYDAAGQLQYVDLRGCCPYPQWRQLLAALAPAGSPLAVARLGGEGLQNLQPFEQQVWGTAGG